MPQLLIETASKGEKVNYGQMQAVMVLAGKRLGYEMPSVANAEKVLGGEPVHVMHQAAIERDAADIHKIIRGDPPEVMAQANKHCADLISEYKLS
ncbi:MAG: hypothetical protein PHV02_03320 [Rhodocyclaceae bacterium]|nr:hypothetical protein [Rhodocyclaceae bacterium]